MEKSINLHFFPKKIEFFFPKTLTFSEVSVGFSIVSGRCFGKVRSSKKLFHRTIYKKSYRVLKFFRRSLRKNLIFCSKTLTI